MPSMRAVLEGREKAALVRVEELRADLVRAEEVLRRRAIGLEEYLEALAGTCDAVPVVAEHGGPAAAGGRCRVLGVSRAGWWPAGTAGCRFRFWGRTTGGSWRPSTARVGRG